MIIKTNLILNFILNGGFKKIILANKTKDENVLLVKVNKL